MYRWGRGSVVVLSSAAALCASLFISQGPTAGAAPPGAVAGARIRAGTTEAAATLPPAPIWKTATGAVPSRPASCPPAAARSKSRPGLRQAPQDSQNGDALWPAPPQGANPEQYRLFDHTPVTVPPTVPDNFGSDSWKLTSGRSTTQSVYSNPQELCGVLGASVDSAWQTTTGRPTTVIAVLDSGIKWCSASVIDRIYLNRAALPLPENAGGLTKQQLEQQGQTFLDPDLYDLIDSGVFNVEQYAADPRVAVTVTAYGGYFCGSEGISAEDLIRTFGDPNLPNGSANPNYYGKTGPAGYTEAIAGWNALDNNNDPFDDVYFGHGTGEAEDMAGAANSTSGDTGSCPNCMIMPIRVGTSFMATGNAFGAAVLFAVDSGATIISSALGGLNYTATDVQAINYAESKGVPIVASAADEESEHQNLPGGLGHMIVVNSVNYEPTWNPASSLYLNGCTNYGAQISVSVPSSSCSSEATGKSAGMIGLLESAAAGAVEAGTIKDYPGLHNASGQPVPLSANEVQQLVTMSADDVNFGTAAPTAVPPAPANNYKVSAPDVPFATTTQFPTTPGFDIYSGWGRINAQRMVAWVAAGRIPPEAEIDSPSEFATLSPTGTLVVRGLVGAVRSSSYKYQVDVAVGAAPSATSWRLLTEGSGTGSYHGVLASVPLSDVAQLFPGGAASLTGGAVTKTGAAAADKFTFTIRVLVEDATGNIGVAQSAEFLHSDSLLTQSYKYGSSIVGPPRLAPLGPNGTNVLIVPESGGTIHAVLPNGHELPGWPVHTLTSAYHPAELAFTSKAVTDPPLGEIIGGVAVGDLAQASGKSYDVVAADMNGYIYAWDSSGKLLPGWPQHVNPVFSEPAARNPNNRLLPGCAAAPALGDLTGKGQLDVIEPCFDRHVYAFGPDGKAVPGWPVLVVDPAKVQSVDPTTNAVTFLPNSNVDRGTELVDTPAIGSLTGKGLPQVILGSDEEYDGAAYANLGALGSILSSAGAPTANSRVYAIFANGALHPASPGAPTPPGMPDPGAFVPGWPAQIAQLDAGILPTVGDGVTASPALADLKGNGQLQVVTSSSAGPIYVLNPNGKSALGYTGKPALPNVGGYAPKGGQILDWTMPVLGSPIVAPIGAPSSAPSVIDPAANLGRLVDQAFPGRQTPGQNELDTWSAATGALGPQFQMSDLQIFNQPIVANVNGTAAGGYVVEGSGLYDLRAYGANGAEAPSFPKFIGGWMTFGPAYGAWGTLGTQVLVAANRWGAVDVWSTPTPATASSGPWPQLHHDLWNTGNLSEVGAANATRH